jgi:hypothetical protein
MSPTITALTFTATSCFKFTWSTKPFNPSESRGNYMYHLFYQPVSVHFVFMGLVRLSVHTTIFSLNNINQLIFVMVKYGVLFEVRIELLHII